MVDITNSTLAVLDKSGKIVGTGYLVAQNLAVTCAHVVAAANAIEGGSLPVQFTGAIEKVNALILPEYCREIAQGDVAFLKLEAVPDGVSPLRLGLAEHSRRGNVFHSFGYASAADVNGIFANGTIDGYLKEHALVQLQSPQADQGISGAPVFDEKRGVVIGVMTKGHTELGRNQYTTFATPSEVLFEVCPEIHSSEVAPYLGLATFTEETRQFFFGRRALTEKLLNVVRGGNRFLAVFGPSGSGKSSVVRAGFLPELKNGGLPGSQKWAQILVRPANDPFGQIGAWGLDLNNVKDYFRSHSDVERILLFIDQFEEVFTLCSDNLREHFVRDLATALEDPRFLLILAMRDDFYSVFNSKAPPLASSPHKTVVDVPAVVERNELVAMIEGPAEAVGLVLGETMTDLIIKDLTRDSEAHSSTLPLLEFALTQLWEKRVDGRLTYEAYQSIGGVTGSLARWADDTYSKLSKADQVLAERLLTSLVHLGDEAQGLPDSRLRRYLAELDASTQRVVNYFANHRLIITSSETFELVHDALIREWDRLRTWVNLNRSSLLLHRQLIDAARNWKRGGRDPSDLYRGKRLSQALQWATMHTSAMGPLEDEFLRAGQARRSRERWAAISRWAGLVGATSLSIVFIFALALDVGPLADWLKARIYQPLPMEWVKVPAGDFWMGSDTGEEDETPVRLVYLSSFEIGKYEVTNHQYSQCVKAGHCLAPPNEKFDSEQYALHPVTDIGWDEADKFCKWTDPNGGLPTEAEWEKAARGTDRRIYPWGNDIDCTRANYLECEIGHSTVVGSYEKGKSYYGVYDMAGNVWEWIADHYQEDYYQNLEPEDPTAPDLGAGTSHVQRGGSWGRPASFARSANREYKATSAVGFRCARSTNP